MEKKSKGKDSLRLREVVTARGRKVVREYMAAFKSGDNRLANFSLAAEHMGWIGVETIPALAEVMGEGEPDERVIAAGLLWIAASKRAQLVTPTSLERCQSVLVDALNDDGNQLLACSLLLNGPVPAAAITRLEKLVYHTDERFSVLAAALLFQTDSGMEIDDELGEMAEFRKTVFKVVFGALEGKNQALAGIAACALIRYGVRDSDAMKELADLFPALPDEMQYSILQTIQFLGPQAVALFDPVAAIFNDVRKHESIREAAALAIGSMTAGSDRAIPLLTRVLRRSSPNWRVISGALRGLHMLGGVPVDALDHLIDLLGKDDEHMRVTAAMGISLLGERAAAATAALIHRMGEEKTIDIGGEMVKALSAIGEPAVPALMAVVVEGDMARCEYAMQALAAIGQYAARHLAQLLRQTDNARVQKMVLGTLAGMGRRAAPAIPVVADILDEAEDEELASYAAIAIWICGPSAVGAIKTLLRCIAIRGCDDPVGMWAERALWSIRETAIPSLKDAIDETSGNHRKNLERALKGMDATFGGEHGELAQYNCDRLFAAFVDIGTVLMELEEAKKPTGLRKVAEILKAKKLTGQLTPGYKGVSAAGIRKYLESLEQELGGISLTTKGGNRSGHLSREGRSWLEKSKAYFNEKSLLRLRYGKK